MSRHSPPDLKIAVSKMHDWILLSLLFEWKTGLVTVLFETYEQGVVSLVTEGVSNLHVPQLREWGPSASVNELRDPLIEP